MKNKLIAILLVAFWMSGAAVASTAQQPDKLYFGGPILTMNSKVPEYVGSVVSRGERIAFVGTLGDARNMFPDAEQIDLHGRLLMPSFRDPHGHFTFGLRMMDQVNVAIPPVGSVTAIADVVEQLASFKNKRGLDNNALLVAWGYDQDGLKEKRHITKLDLDERFPDNPVIIIHVSGHGAILNSRALAMAGISASTETPEGGVIARLPGGKEPAGLLMETAWIPLMAMLPVPTEEHRLEIIEDAQMEYARNGYTNAVDGFATTEDVAFLQRAAASGKLFIDVAALMAFIEINKWLDNPQFPFAPDYTDHFRIAAMKITQDGSPQGRTAFMREPYLKGGPAGQKNWRGSPSVSKKELERLVTIAVDKKLPLQVHGNGDAAIDMIIAAVEAAGLSAKDDHRTVVIHSNIQAIDQLDSYVRLGLTPSYFSNHAFFWGDVHMENFGRDRAFNISPMKTAGEKGLIFSNHTDFNITPLDPMFTVWTAMKRESRSGVTIGPDERIGAYAALQAITTAPVWQFFEEKRVGSLQPGMEASFVILSRDPLEITEVDEIRNVKVLETIKAGKTIYSHPK